MTAGAANEPALDENDLGEAWADLGASFGAQAGRDSLSYALRSLTEPDLLERAARWPRARSPSPAFPRPCGSASARAGARPSRRPTPAPAPVASKAFGSAIYGDHPYGQKPSEETLARIAVADLQAFHQRAVAACRARVSIVGALDARPGPGPGAAPAGAPARSAAAPTARRCPPCPMPSRCKRRCSRTFPLPRPRPRC